jgi:HTH-type transcriptional regulator, sugar sensing transcriptional regulator
MSIIKTELIKKTKDYFDLNIYETKVWLALLTKGISSAGEIAEMSGVPRSRTYDVLEGLEKRGFAIEKIGKPVKYIAVKPEIIIEKLKNNTMKYAEEKVQVLEKLRDSPEYEEIQSLHNSGLEPLKNQNVSSSIKGRSNLYGQMRDIMESAGDTIHMASSSFELNSKLRMFSEVFAKLKKRNVDVKIIIPEDEDEAKKLSKKFGVPIKSKKINGRFVVVDRKEIIFTIKPNTTHEDGDHAFWINSCYFTNSLAYMFELAWKD